MSKCRPKLPEIDQNRHVQAVKGTKNGKSSRKYFALLTDTFKGQDI